MHSFYTIDFLKGKVSMINQLLLPQQEIYEEYDNYQDVAAAIKDMVIRGAPAIGIAAAYGIAIAYTNKKEPLKEPEYFEKVAHTFAQTRPTAVNLFWAIDRMRKCYLKFQSVTHSTLAQELLNEAKKIHHEDIEMCKQIGEHGGSLIKDGYTILTHCNAGALATGGWGTALGVIRTAALTKKIKVFSCETRPYLQGARLTCWELSKDKIDTTLISDNMAAYFMSKGLIDCVIVGADRVASNGDCCNKIGSLSHAICANYFKIPMYFAMPTSTIDTKIKNGKEIPIEERSARELTHIKDIEIATRGVNIKNPAFDVTPAQLISAIITEKGVFKHPYNFTA